MSSWYPCCCPVPGYSGQPLPQTSSLPPPASGSSQPLGEHCVHCAPGTTHRKYQVEISGIQADPLCAAGCELYNGTYILTQCFDRGLTHPDECATGGTPPADECSWAIGWQHQSICTCDAGLVCLEHRDWIRLTFDDHITVQVYGDFTERLKFQQPRMLGDTCRLDQRDLPLASSGTVCDTTNAACTVSVVE